MYDTKHMMMIIMDLNIRYLYKQIKAAATIFN